MSALSGVDELMAELNRLRINVPLKAGRAGISAGLAIMVRSMRQAVNNSGASSQMKRAARQTIGKRLLSDTRQLIGKAGFGVGKPSKRKKEKAKSRAGDKSRGGVGISASNIHWAVLGTADREAGVKCGAGGRFQKIGKLRRYLIGKTHRTGAMPAILAGVIEPAVREASAPAMAAMAEKIEQIVAAEAAKHT